MISSISPLAFLAAVVVVGSQVSDRVAPKVTQGANPDRRLLDAVTAYSSMGLAVAGEPLPFVASLAFLSGPEPDSTLVVFALSLANRDLSFRRVDSNFEARYSVRLTFKDEGVVRARLDAAEVVRVASYRETVRRDESVIYQKFLFLHPGRLVTEVTVSDAFGSDTTRSDLTIDVPRFGGRPMLSSIISVYQGDGRVSLGAGPGVVVNARASTAYGQDSLRFYVEGYRVPANRRARVRVIGSRGTALWTDSVTFASRGRSLSAAFVAVPSDLLGVGTMQVDVTLGDLPTVSSPVLVALSDERVVASYDDLVSLLRYFDDTSRVMTLRVAAAEERPAEWKEFWTATDTDPGTTANEVLERYFMRVEEANVRFQESGTPGWMTERGEVFVTLGVPDDVRNIDHSRSSGERLVRWRYFEEELTLYFVDEANLGRLRLTPASRADFASVASKQRKDRDG